MYTTFDVFSMNFDQNGVSCRRTESTPVQKGEPMKKDRPLSLVMTQELYNRLETIAQSEVRHVSAQARYFIQQGVAAYERQHAADFSQQRTCRTKKARP